MKTKKLLKILAALFILTFLSSGWLYLGLNPSTPHETLKLPAIEEEQIRQSVEDDYLDWLKEQDHFKKESFNGAKLSHFYTIAYRGEKARAVNYEIFYQLKRSEGDIFFYISYKSSKLIAAEDSLGYNYITSKQEGIKDFPILDRIAEAGETCGGPGGNYCRAGLECLADAGTTTKICR